MEIPGIDKALDILDGSLTISDGKASILDEEKLKSNIAKLAEVSVLGDGFEQSAARYVVRLAALAFGAVPSSIHDLYMARGKNKLPHTFTVPALNLRMLSYDAARAAFRVANEMNAGAFIFEIARSEMGYTEQRPTEFVTNILAAAITEGYKGPVFIQGDHFQVSASRYNADPETELQAVRDLCKEAIDAGYFNIDIDTSTLVDLDLETITEQQELNSSLSAMFTGYIRSIEPEGVTVSVGGEIGEVGGHNSTEEELRAYMGGFINELVNLSPDAAGLSKISIQTGTSHGGVVLPDGSIAEVAVDFNTLLNLSRVARDSYGTGGAVQHGASTLPEDAFGKFVESEAIEVHLATNFQNIAFNLLPDELVNNMYEFLDENRAGDRKPDMTADQFYYKTRKYSIGPFKSQLWNLPAETRGSIGKAWEEQFKKLFELLGMQDTREFTESFITPAKVEPELSIYFDFVSIEEDVSDLAD